MADDPTVRISIRRPERCPTCGHNTSPEDSMCSLCGSTLLHDVASSTPPQNLPPLETVPLSTEAAEPTLITPLPPRPPRGQRKTAKTVSSTLAQLEPSTRPQSLQLPILPPPVPPQLSPATRWGGFVAGVLALFLVSFFATKLLSSLRGGNAGVSGVPKTTADSHDGQLSSGDDTEPEAGALALAPPVDVVPSLEVRVVTADQLLPIRIFGAAPHDQLRGSSTFRTQIEGGLKGIRDAYRARMTETAESPSAVVLELNVSPQGQVASVAVHTTGRVSRSLQHEITTVAQGWEFPPVVDGGEVKVFYPLLLSPEKIDPAAFVSHVKEVWPGRYKVLAATSVPVRAEANDTAQEVGTIGPGLFLSVISSQNGWLGALSPKGKVGYVRQDTIFPRAENPTSTDAEG